MGCVASAPKEVPVESIGDKIDILVTSPTVTVSTQVQTRMFSMKSAVKSEVKDDALLGEISSQGQTNNRRLLCAIQKLEIPKIGMGQAMAMVAGGPIDIKTTYDCFYGSPGSNKIDSVCVVVPITMQTLIKPGFFNTKVDTQAQGLEQLGTTITTYQQNGFRLVATVPGPSSGESNGGLGGVASGGGMLLKLIFQQPDLSAGGAAPPAYTEHMMLVFELQQTISPLGAIKLKPFDLLSALQDWGKQGWEATGICPLIVPVQPGSGGLGSTISTYYQVFMIKRGDAPISYSMKEVDLKLKLGLQVSIVGSIVPSVTAHAEAGWSVFGAIQMPPKQNGMTQKMPVRCYFSNAPA